MNMILNLKDIDVIVEALKLIGRHDLSDKIKEEKEIELYFEQHGEFPM